MSRFCAKLERLVNKVPEINKLQNRAIRKRRIRAIVKGTAKQPRLSIFISNNHVSAQIINDEDGKTLVAATSVGQKYTGNMTEIAKKVGVDIAKKAKKAKITKVTLDRSGKKYTGRIKALAEAAREEGLIF
jgi:large subunit ribosomal protein L18